MTAVAQKHKKLFLVQYFEDKRGKKSAVKRYTRSKFGNFMLVVFLLAGGLFSMLPLIKLFY